MKSSHGRRIDGRVGLIDGMKHETKISLEGAYFKPLSFSWYTMLLSFCWYVTPLNDFYGYISLFLFSAIIFSVWWLTQGRTYKVVFLEEKKLLGVLRFNSRHLIPLSEIRLISPPILAGFLGVFILQHEGQSFYYQGQRNIFKSIFFSKIQLLSKREAALERAPTQRCLFFIDEIKPCIVTS